jgi:predicted metallo-beta-lactamase superfamily hydrolase
MYRFSDISGKLNHDKFRQSYDFLEQNQEEEIKNYEKIIKQSRAPEVVDHLKAELIK